MGWVEAVECARLWVGRWGLIGLGLVDGAVGGSIFPFALVDLGFEWCIHFRCVVGKIYSVMGLFGFDRLYFKLYGMGVMA
jgi:hypothetical protein